MQQCGEKRKSGLVLLGPGLDMLSLRSRWGVGNFRGFLFIEQSIENKHGYQGGNSGGEGVERDELGNCC